MGIFMQRVSKENVIYGMSAENKPVLYVDPGSLVLFETWDALHGQIKSDDGELDGLDWDRVNPATGPVYINGAQKGDILSVKIEKIDVADTGFLICGEGSGVMGNVLKGTTVKVINIKGNNAIFSDDIHLPLNKMIGVLGVAPQGDAIPCSTPDLHGGNMDCKEVCEGATILLPVNVPGALLAMGDLHAVMADGEIGVSGLEVSGEVTITVDLIKGKTLPLPMILNDEHVMTLASDEDLDKAVDMAVANMIDYLSLEHGFSMEDAVMLTSMIADVKICQVVDPKKTIRVEFPRKYLPVKT